MSAAGAVARVGYGGQYCDYFEKDGHVLPPRIPRRYTHFQMPCDQDNNWKFYQYKWKDAFVPAPPDLRISQLHGIRYPAGEHNLDHDDVNIRDGGYFPFISVLSGFIEILASIIMIYKNVILNQNTYSTFKRSRIHSDGVTQLYTFKVQPVQLGMWQRFLLLINALGVMLRGILTFAQVGFLFYPLDKLCERQN